MSEAAQFLLPLPPADLHDRRAVLDSIKLCGTKKNLHQIRRIHTQILRTQQLSRDIYVITALISAYGKCGALKKAQDVFNQLPVRNVVSWTALIAGYANHGLCNEALRCFRQMRDEGIAPNAVTFTAILKACSGLGASHVGEEIHAEINDLGLLRENLVLGTALMDMYAICGELRKARKVFYELPFPDIVAWNSLISGYAHSGFAEEALATYKEMQAHHLSPDRVTFICVLTASGNVRSSQIGEEVHAEIRKQGLLGKDVTLDTTLVDMYAKCGMLEKAQKLFDELPNRNVVTWTALINGYAQHELMDEALECFARMRAARQHPNAITFISVLKACGSTGFLEMGRNIHAEVREQGLLAKDIVLATALVDMYAKCGMLPKARETFNELPLKDVVSWNALVAGYAQMGDIEIVFDLYSAMVKEDYVPDQVTFLLLLTLCSHAGLVEEGQVIFDEISSHYSTPTSEHYACMVDILSRAGQFSESLTLVEKVSSSARSQIWLVLLGSCQTWTNVRVGKWAYQQLVQFEENCAAAYIGMGNIYAFAAMQEEREAELIKIHEWGRN